MRQPGSRYRRLGSLLILSLALSPLTASSAFAQESEEDGLDLMELMEISVGSNVVTDPKAQPVSVTVVTSTELQHSGARNLSEALMMFVPGFFVVEDQDDTIAGFRGLAPDNNVKVMLLLNGERMNTEWFWGPPDALLHSLTFDFIERVEVIRGPGSVTLGQGALLGVINIVTKSGKTMNGGKDGISVQGTAKGGMFDYKAGSLQMGFLSGDLEGYFYVGATQFEGPELRDEGWARDKAHEGWRSEGQMDFTVADAGHRLKRGDSLIALGTTKYKNLRLDMQYIEQGRDLYNFYRDRDRVRQRLLNMVGSYEHEFTEDMSLTIQASAAQDDYGLSTVGGLTTGGVREERLGAKALFKAKEIFEGNSLAAGVEIRAYKMGLENYNRDNFIANNLNEATLRELIQATGNTTASRSWVYPYDINLFSVFAEDFHEFMPEVKVFAAARLDVHPDWGTAITPRVGGLFRPLDALRLRASYQSGFRGAAGVHYAGGYKRDGFLREENFSLAAQQIPGQDPLNPTEPEKMHSFELQANYEMLEQGLTFDVVGFYNIVENVIDVGVIWRDPAEFSVPDLGSDQAGDWNGYWFYKNNPGEIHQVGAEAAIDYRHKYVHARLTHALVKVASADQGADGAASMYLTANNNFKAFPENVTRLNVKAFPIDGLTLALDYIYWWEWFSPQDQSVAGNHTANLSGSYLFENGISIAATVKNVFSQTNLYPMNSNAGGADLSDGAPAVEETNFWIQLGYKFGSEL